MSNIFFNAIKQKKGATLFYLLLLLTSKIFLILYPLYLNYCLKVNQKITHIEIVLLVIVSIMLPILLFLKNKQLNYINNVLSMDISRDLFNEIYHKEVLELQKFSDDYIVRVVCCFAGLVCNFFLFNIIDSIASILTGLVMLYILWTYSPYLALFILSLNILRLLILKIANRLLKEKTDQKIVANNKYLTAFTQYIIKVKAIIVRNLQQSSLKSLENLAIKNLQATSSYGLIDAIIATLNNAGDWIIRFLTIIFGLFLTTITTLNVTSIQVAFMYVQDISALFNTVSYWLPAYTELKSYYDTLVELLNIRKTSDKGLKNHFNTLQIENANFYYHKNQPVIQNFNYTFTSNNVYIIKGENGSGKSTLIKVLTGMYPLNRGQIYLDGKKIEEYNMTYYQTHLMSILTQDDLLFNDTILNNLNRTQEQKVQHICEQLEIGDLNKTVLVGGNNLSGGQKRKILLARVFLEIERNNPSLVIFDEPTYALEPKVAQRVNEMINEIAKNRIVIIISHESTKQVTVLKNIKEIHI